MPTASRTFDKKHLTFDLKSIVNCHPFDKLRMTLSLPKGQLSIVRKAKGFTLIELLIVITIIGLLASLTLASFGAAQAKARDGVRKSDLAQVKRALELAKSDCQGNAWYPYFASAAGTTIPQAVTDYGTKTASGISTLRGYLSATALTYMSSVPLDPKDQDSSPSGSDNRYQYNVSGVSSNANVCPSSAGASGAQYGATNYLLAVQLERKTDNDAKDSYDRCYTKPNMPNYYDGTGTYPGWYFICNN